MSTIRTSRHRQVWTGLLLFFIGFCGEGISGVLLFNGGDLRFLLLHILTVLVWAFGINLICNHRALVGASPYNWRTFVNKWGVGALFLGLFTLPGLGTLMYSVALALAILLQRKKGDVSKELEPAPENIHVSETSPSVTIDVLQDTETRRLAVTVLNRQGTPEAMQVLRQLLLDPHEQIRTDASIALTHLEERLSRSLSTFFRQWTKNPSDRECILNLADQYYQYAQSNVLDEASQHFYLLEALDLLQHATMQGATEAEIWLRQACIRQQLNKCEEALQDIRVAIQLSPHMSETRSISPCLIEQ